MKELQGLIFNIQKFSLHDGPGIRTVVFFKGCPLSCKWCSNPESQSAKPEVLKPLRTKEDEEIYGEYKNVDEIMAEILQDKEFYEESGGGVTFSGGEVLMQTDFVKALLLRCKKEGLHTVLETSGYASTAVFKKLLNKADLFLYDIKHYDRQKHFEGTGVYNDVIVRNLQILLRTKKNILVRIPVIPDFNDSLEDAKGFAHLFRNMNVQLVQLLPFHQFGQNKYCRLGMPYEFEHYSALQDKDLGEYKDIFEQFSVKILL